MPHRACTAFVCAASFLAVVPAVAQSVAVERYVLKNGLTVILHPDKALPVAFVNLWYRVGAKEEPAGRSGFAHLFEHLMFMGTQRVPGNDFDVLMETGGGSNNATTSLDRTNYFSNGPATLLPTLLWLDADRLEDVGRTMTTEKLNKQRDVVRNEIRQNVENTPYGKAEETVFRLMYPPEHPYHNAVYGLHEHLEAATVGDVKTFFATFYVPSNCSLVVAGDFEPAAIKPVIEGLYASIPAGAAVSRREPKDFPVPVLGKVVRSTLLDNVEQAKVSMVYHSPPQYAAGDAEMDLVAALLSQGKGSPLQRRLVLEEKLATEVSAYQQGSVLGGLFFIDVMASPGADPGRIEAIIDEEVERLTQSGPAAADLEARKATIELGFLGRMDSVENVADKLNEYEYFFGEPDSFKRDLDRWRQATPAGVRDWTGRVLTPGSRLVLRTLPQEPERAGSARDQRPESAASAEFRVPRPDGFTLENGLKVLVWNRPQVPLVSLNLLVRPEGAVLVAPAKAGLGQLAADMLEEGAGTRDAVAFSEAVQALGAEFSSTAGYDHFLVGMTALKRNLQPAAALLADAVLRPRFEATDFERVKRLHLDALEQELSDPQAVASRAGQRFLLGDSHAYGLPASGTRTTVERLTLADANALHDWAFSPASTTVLVSGDITTDEARTLVSGLLGSWTASSAAHPAPFSGPSQTFIPFDPRKVWQEGDGLKIALVDRPDAVQTVLRLIIPNVNFADATRPYRRVLNAVVGGSFTSRLNQKLREELGYTYGAGSSFQMMAGGGLFIASTSVKADTTGASVRELLHEIGRVRGADITDAEGTKAQETVRTQIIQSLSGIHGPITATIPYLVAGKAPAQLAEDFAEIQRATAFEINRLAGPAIPIERGVLVLVGDKRLILEQIKDLHLGAVIQIDEQGVPVPQSGIEPASKPAP